MLRATILLPALLTTLAAAAPSWLAQRADSCAGDKSVAGYCTPISYTDVTTSSSSSAPSSSDCQQTCQSILTDAGDWGVDFTGQPAGYRDEMYLGKCGFGIARETDSDTSQFSFSVNNQDIVDVVGESINRFAGQHGGKVKAEGTMNCSGHVVRWFVG
ncbi:putative necrosis-inducing factor-domain-containing protein [Hypoxylon trugodes]|uniref:putative necrosis-inducing factor-domain-containing protein n=1 Tax=Hypoxylon trugodes TaxID=326681 RepID=UPI0021A20AFA|nr:putative necrosis-inducing factor-domain-containing protein [Hypoxylon trugodes]KAI1391880.1 putative necrosis-inducing factor-domain-containing protein [Hypoxylon trugodes]